MPTNWLFVGMVVTGALIAISWFYRFAYDRGYQEAVRWEKRAAAIRGAINDPAEAEHGSKQFLSGFRAREGGDE